MRRRIGVGTAALGVGAMLAWWVTDERGGRHRPVVRTIPVRDEIERVARGEPSEAVELALAGPTGPAVDGELRRRSLAEAIRQDNATVLDVLLVDALDPTAPRGTPRADGNDALLDLDPGRGPLLVEAPADAQADPLSMCVVRGFWCLVVTDRSAAEPAWAKASGAPTAALVVHRAAEALPTEVTATWIAPDARRLLHH